MVYQKGIEAATEFFIRRRISPEKKHFLSQIKFAAHPALCTQILLKGGENGAIKVLSSPS